MRELIVIGYDDEHRAAEVKVVLKKRPQDVALLRCRGTPPVHPRQGQQERSCTLSLVAMTELRWAA